MFSAIAVGMYVFLRALKLSTAACVLAAATYAFAGPVLSQVNHVDMTEGFVAIPWMLLAVLHIVRDGRWRWTILLGIAYATVILAGAPEAMLDEALLIIAFAVMSAGLNRERWWRVVSRCGTGAALALSLAAIQWLPGLEAIRNSQRGSGVIAGAGSYPRPFTVLGLVPYIDGGYGHLGEAQFFGQYNLPEVGIYLGILPVIALITLLNRRWPSRIPPRDRLTWYVVGLFGLLLALGSNTPLEHLFNSLPLYGNQRLQSRNMITVATAVCVLFAGWIDRTEAPRLREPMTRYDRIMALVPAAAVAGLAVWALVSPRTLVWRLAGVSLRPAITNTVREATAIALAFCVGAAVLVWIRPRLGTRVVVSPRRRLRRRRSGSDGVDQPVDPDGTERPARRHHADAEADGGEACHQVVGSSTTTPRRTRATRGASRAYPISTSSRACPRCPGTRRSSTGTTSR